MRKKIGLLLLLVFSMVSFGEREDDRKEKIIKNLMEIQDSYYHYLNKQERREAKKLMNETIRMIENSFDDNEKEVVMNNNAYKTLYNEVKSKLSDREKTGIIVAGTIQSKISSQQFKELVELYVFDSDIEECIYKVYKNISDKENFIIVISAIKSDFVKERVNKFLEKNR